MESSELIELQIGAVANGGWCVARHDGRVVFVRHTLPGERVRARVTQETKNFLRADAVEILEASPDRVQAPCPFAGPGRCGGCDWQHASLPAQRRLKAEVVQEQLRRLAGIERDVVVEEVPGAPDGLGWRTRVQFAVRRDGVIGLRKHRSHQIEPIDECLIAHPQVEALGIERKRWPGATGVEAIASAGTGDRLAVLSSRGRARVPRMDAPVRLVSGKREDKPPFVREEAAGRLWQVSGSGFWQVHPGAAETLAAAVLDTLEPRKGDIAVDLYCGAGLFAGVLGEAVGSDGLVVGIESEGQAVRDARFNLRDLPHVSVERGEVEQVLDQIKFGRGKSTLNRADLVVLDPPRTGAGRDVVKRVAELAGRRIAYVSCDPATLARDLAFFSEYGWTLSALRAFDAFPMTQHVECVATLIRG
ncbi:MULTISPECIES: class I SAM-dependent RNA methyltransferase [Actinoallomurus]|uniref:class I SAM-dependent RNA methyltransferase n=1 Tax=Actinoallomurus TaxID=667113 RepID=UPI0020911360|nr:MULTISPECIES: class I SAM-dependent RNA methyltransferase [Actinoallomurus]MCO5970608.1 class I SAM-dependent RNA methyltransferase [Actinoallomurus soli]MCO5993517.1 class I SAM-dependent RNA methyltransferase [Actinoallomurus rhizosphaericola]